MTEYLLHSRPGQSVRWCILTLFAAMLIVPVLVSAETLTSDKEQYRRSSLCLILLTHRDKKYAEAMERVFRDFPLPARYNEHNIYDVRVLSVKGRQSKADIDRLITNNAVAQKVVARWFDRNPYSGRMDMDLIHERGGYGAFYSDYERTVANMRGTELLRDEGIELLQSTFVLVCDMDYIDKKKRAKWGAIGLAVLSGASAIMSGINEVQSFKAASHGDYSEANRKHESAQLWNMGSQVSATAAAVVADIGGFRVKMNAYLYKLRWDDNMTQTMYSRYWSDYSTPPSEAQNKKALFENSSRAFSVEFVGKYSATSSKTILRSWSNEDEVILDVCERCVNKGMKELAKKFVVFRPRVPFYFDGGSLYSHIGNKEDVTYGKKYEVVRPYKDKKGQICYKRVTTATAGAPWNNRNIRFDQYFDTTEKGTRFFCSKSQEELQLPGLQLREM